MNVSLEKNSRIVTSCRYCKSNNLTKFLSLGDQPPSNSFINKSQISTEKKYPLDALFCTNCYLVQLSVVVSAKSIFNDYYYLSSSSKALVLHYAKLAKHLTKEFSLKKGDVALDIGCNDGILLHGYNSNLTRIGVEPSKVAEIAIKSGLTVIKKFFNPKCAQLIVKKYGKVKIITATNVFAHVDNIDEFVEGLQIALDDNGTFVIEAPYLLDMFSQTLFDTIYHEHLSYLSLTPLVLFFKKFGLEVYNVEQIPFGASGPAIRVYVGYKGKNKINQSVKKMLFFEKNWGIENIKNYMHFTKQVENIKFQVLKIIKIIKSKKEEIGGYTGPAKGNTLLNYFEITPDMLTCIAETNPLKQNMLTPGSHIQIVSEEIFLQKMPKYALLLSWNYLDFFLKNSEYIKKGGQFIVPLPNPKIVK